MSLAAFAAQAGAQVVVPVDVAAESVLEALKESAAALAVRYCQRQTRVDFALVSQPIDSARPQRNPSEVA